MGPKLDTVQATTSGTEKDFTIPSWAKRVTVMFSGVSLDGTNAPLIQLGDSGGIEATGYSGSSSNGTDEALSTGFTVTPAGSASSTIHGSVVLTLLNSSANTWTAMGVIGRSDTAQMGFVGGSKSLSGALTTVRVTSEGTPDDFDAGSVNVIIE